MPSKSKAQQRFMGMVLSRKRGENVGSAKVAKAASSMTTKQIEDFASTKRKRLPKKKNPKKEYGKLLYAKLRSKGKGRGLGYGGAKGPIGVPYKAK